ncbi:MAG: hypothetical protein PHZ03_01495 [Syntrophomonas sp.]|nr:hypothetical protein [Syntrophomonas sp.]
MPSRGQGDGSFVPLDNDKNQIHHIRVSGQKEVAHEDIYRKLNIKDPTKRIHRVLNK